MKISKLLALVFVTLVIAILLASALNSFTRTSDSALAQISPPLLDGGGGRGGGNAPRTAPGKNYLPIIFLNAPTDSFWSLSGNTGTLDGTNFLGTTDNITLTFRVSNTVAFRLAPAGGTNTPNVIGGYSGNVVAPEVYAATIAGGGSSGAPNQVSGNYGAIGGGFLNSANSYVATIGGGDLNSVSGDYAIIGGGSGNKVLVTGTYAFIGGGAGNTASNSYATIGGGSQNTASGYLATVGGGTNNQATTSYTVVGGGNQNSALGLDATVGGGLANTAGGNGAVVGGGGYNGVSTFGNQANANASTIGGGFGNLIPLSGTYAFVGGGYQNTANADRAAIGGGTGNLVLVSGADAFIGGGNQNTASGKNAFIGGGNQNTASAYVATVGGGLINQATISYTVVSGGYQNTASNQYAAIGGGQLNSAGGQYAAVPGGAHNVASGDYSFAAGQHANTNNQVGSFVWGDNSSTNYISATVANQFLVRASGGITLYTNSAATIGASLYPGSGSWNNLSNKNMKANFANVDSHAILAQVNALPITTWNYTTQDASIRHIGPMAQDFAAAFNVGENDTTISTVDAQGVALAAIQGLSEENQDLKAQNATLKEQFATYQNETNARLVALEQVPHPSTIDAGQAQAQIQGLPLQNNWFIVGALIIVAFVVGRRARI